jgi:broad specificity phosphatase PhoE
MARRTIPALPKGNLSATDWIWRRSAKRAAQAKAVAGDPRLCDAELIVSSPYTRALQTAAIIALHTGLSIKIETDLHEWLPDKSFQYDSGEYSAMALSQCAVHKGERTDNPECKWESLREVAERAINAMKKYASMNKVIAVSHGIVIRQFVNAGNIPYCGLLETDFDINFKWKGFNEETYRRFVIA